MGESRSLWLAGRSWQQREVRAEGGAFGKGSHRIPGKRKGADGEQKWARKQVGNQSARRVGWRRRRRGGNQSAPKAGIHREWRRPLAALGPPRSPRFPGDSAPTPPRPGEARALTGGPPGPSAPRLPRPRLPPARPRARSPAHAAGHWPQPPGWDRTKLLVAAACAGSAVASGEHWAGCARRPDTQRTAHARAAPTRASCWTGGVKAPLRVSPR